MNQMPCNKQLSLVNDGQLEVVFLGTGTSFTQELYQTNYLIVKGNTHILVDFGMTGPAALRNVLGIPIEDIRVVLPTHSHADHIGGLENLSLINRYISVPRGLAKLKMIITDEYRDILWNMSLKGGLRFNERDDQQRYLTFEDYFDPIVPTEFGDVSRRRHRLEYGGVSIELFHTNHIHGEATDVQSAFVTYGMLIDDRVFVSGDTKFDRDLIDMYADRAEIMFHDASFHPVQVHASIDELRTLPSEIKKKMLLMHYPDNYMEVDASDFSGYAIPGMRYIF